MNFSWNCMSENVLIICDFFFFPLSGSLWNLVFVPRVLNFITTYLSVDWFVSSVLGVICPLKLEAHGPLNLGKFSQFFLTDAFPPSIFSVVFFWNFYYLDIGPAELVSIFPSFFFPFCSTFLKTSPALYSISHLYWVFLFFYSCISFSLLWNASF